MRLPLVRREPYAFRARNCFGVGHRGARFQRLHNSLLHRLNRQGLQAIPGLLRKHLVQVVIIRHLDCRLVIPRDYVQLMRVARESYRLHTFCRPRDSSARRKHKRSGLQRIFVIGIRVIVINKKYITPAIVYSHMCESANLLDDVAEHHRLVLLIEKILL